MKLLKLTIALIAIAGVTVNASRLSTAAERKPPVAYFQTSNDADVPIDVPPEAKDIVVAKVHFLMKGAWLGGRHCEGCTNDILSTRVKIIEVKRGTAEIGQVYDVRMGLRNDYWEFAHPHTPEQLGQEYMVMIYASDDGLHRLASFPISSSQYAQWNEEVWAYERKRGKPGHRDR